MFQRFAPSGHTRLIFATTLGLLLLLIATACSSGAAEKKTDSNGHNTEVVEVTFSVVEEGKLEFAPLNARVVVGKKVMLTLHNTGRLEHDLLVADIPAEIEADAGHGGDAGHAAAEVAVHTLPGTKASVVFTPTHPGTYEVLCTLPGHKDAGMVGHLVVVA
ncbi:MAG: hypothetical protein HY681_14120 [Chloroflexi bacterium]|nr:hypothetical protein [Chloroflexota bacterium]